MSTDGAAAVAPEQLLDRVQFGGDGLVVAVVQDADTGRVLTVAYMSRESLEKTLATGQTWFWSRSRNELWHKGATSGNTQSVRGVILDCDCDALLVLVAPAGPACHTGATSCFTAILSGSAAQSFTAIGDLVGVIADRADAAQTESSYTASLLARGIDQVCKKVGEEATEVVLAAKGDEHDQVVYESADLLYHLAVLWRATGITPAEVAAELERRRA
jgi:phosphoribosyl-AMP cyclohydrolase / phosphoribosyl-ATP pyrophosphohydrolase